ncbi:hypothetical protein D3C72_1941300 [compost metagenome]
MLTGGDGISVRGINDYNTTLRSRLQLDVVNSDSGTADNLQVGAGSDYFLCNRRLAADKQAVVFANDGNQFIFAKSCFLIHNYIVCVHQLLNAQIADWIRY